VTDLQEMAIAACVKARAEARPRPVDPHGAPPVSLLLAIKFLREETGLGIRECKPLVEWAMPRTQSADALPDGSVVAKRNVVYVKNHPTATAQWRGSNGGYFGDWKVDDALREGAVVLRVGYGKE
jgi:hypothetical protein